MSNFTKIKRLYELGHFFNPKYPNAHNVKLIDIVKLTFQDQIVKDALASFQWIMSGPEKEHGELGPLTVNLFDIPRCGLPDYHDPSLLGKVGTGSWPEPCQKAGVTYSVDKSGMPSRFKDTWDTQVLKPVVDTYGKVGLKLIPFTGTTGKANIRTSFTFLPGSTIGYSEYNSEGCSDSVFSHLDTSYAPNEATEADLVCHEWGHCMNLNHTRGGIMNPSLSNQDTFEGWTPSDPSWSTLVKYFGGEPIDPTPGPGPTLPDTLTFSVPGGFTVFIDFPSKDLIITDPSAKIKKYVILNNDII
jgi:hypothetical protein